MVIVFHEFLKKIVQVFLKLRVKYSLDGSDSDTYLEKRRYKLELDEWFNVKKTGHRGQNISYDGN